VRATDGRLLPANPALDVSYCYTEADKGGGNSENVRKRIGESLTDILGGRGNECDNFCGGHVRGLLKLLNRLIRLYPSFE